MASRGASAEVWVCGWDPISPPHYQPVAGGARPVETSVPEMCLHSTSSVPESKSACPGQCPEQPLTQLLAAPPPHPGDHRPASALHGRPHRNLGLGPHGCRHHRFGLGSKVSSHLPSLLYLSFFFFFLKKVFNVSKYT